MRGAKRIGQISGLIIAGATLSLTAYAQDESIIDATSRIDDLTQIQDPIADLDLIASPAFAAAGANAKDKSKRVFSVAELRGAADKCVGETFVLEKSSVKSNLGGQYTSNATQTDGGNGDFVLAPSLSGALVLSSNTGSCADNAAGKLQFFPSRQMSASLSSSLIDYTDDEANDASSLELRLSITNRLGSALTANGDFKNKVSFTVAPKVVELDVFGDWIATSYSVDAAVIRTLYNDGATAGIATLKAGRVFSNPDIASRNFISLNYTTVFPKIQTFPNWTAKGSISATLTDYDKAEPASFTEDAYSIGLSVERPLGNGVSLKTGFTGSLRNSDVDTREYEAASMPLFIGLSKSF